MWLCINAAPHTSCQCRKELGYSLAVSGGAFAFTITLYSIILLGAFEENGPPTVVADRLSASFPNLLNLGVHYRVREVIEEADKWVSTPENFVPSTYLLDLRETLDGLRRVGFKLTRGYKDSGVLLCVFKKAGGYYLGQSRMGTWARCCVFWHLADVGGSQYIIDGKIKLKNDATLESFSETGLKFADGSELPADVVVFCTGYAGPLQPEGNILIQKILKPRKCSWRRSKDFGPRPFRGCGGNLGFEWWRRV